MNLTCIFFGIIFTIAGFMFSCGKGHIHLSSLEKHAAGRERKDQNCAALP